MSWAEELYKVYELNCGKSDGENMLLPIFHSTAKAQIEITVDEEGNLLDAQKVQSKEDGQTVIPVTEDSGSRSSGITPHPFADKIKYMAGDYSQYIDDEDSVKYYEAYMLQLASWADSEFSHSAVTALYRYIKKGYLIGDLLRFRVLEADAETGKVGDNPKILGIKQPDCFVRIIVHYEDLKKESRTWCDSTLYDCFIKFQSANMGKRQLCYATGNILPCTYKHPQKIRNEGDKAKLISTNDESGYTYRGRFDSKEQAISVSYEFSQKMHNALKWLISKQGIPIGSMELLVWENHMSRLPSIEKDVSALFGIEDEETESFLADTNPKYRDMLKKCIFGWRSKLQPDSKVMVMAMDAATTGRLAVTMYSELKGSVFLDNIERWHEDTAWYRYDAKLRKTVVRSFSLREIAEYAFGTERDKFVKSRDELRNDAVARLIPCVTEGRRLPKDIVNSLVIKACNPLAYSAEGHNWDRVLETACGMIRRTVIEKKKDIQQEGEDYMGLDSECRSRDYLYGRLLAAADMAESAAYDESDRNSGRITNARRYFQIFSNRPYSTWDVIYKRLEPYLNRMKPERRTYYDKLINEISGLFEREEFMDNSRLQPEFLLAYSCQKNEIYKGKDKKED